MSRGPDNWPPRKPSPEDVEEATRFVDQEYRLQVCPTYFANNREENIARVAKAVMQRREHAERKAMFQPIKRRAA
jgi:hypothetical protein